MPDRGSIEELIMNAEDVLRIETTDLSVYFYSLKIPETLEGLQVLPLLLISPEEHLGGSSGLLYPTLCVATMGVRHSYTFAQAVHRRLWNVPSSIFYYRG